MAGMVDTTGRTALAHTPDVFWIEVGRKKFVFDIVPQSVPDVARGRVGIWLECTKRGGGG